MTDDEMYMCKYSTAGEDQDGFTVPYCTLCNLPCEMVLRYGDEGCIYSKGGKK